MITVFKWRPLAQLVLAASFFASFNALCGEPGFRKGQATAMEILQHSKFCWWEYDARYTATLQLVQNCGPFMNHFCPGELSLIRSRDVSKSQGERLRLLGIALSETEYTLRGMKDYPACSIRGTVNRRYGEIRAAFLKLGQPMPPSKLGSR